MVNPEFSISAKEGVSKSVFYSNLLSEAKSLISNEVDLIANTSNLSSLIYHGLNERDANAKVNWAGFYFMRKKGEKPSELVLGPFQGLSFPISFLCIQLIFLVFPKVKWHA